MKIKPSYYDKFRCTASKCPLTCCMQWKIAVDEETKREWEAKTFEGKVLSSYVTEKDGTDVICLNGQKFCPFLNEKKLCSLVTLYGEDVLSETCHIFPRQIHDFGDRKEYSLVSCCPAVIDLIDRENEIVIPGLEDIAGNLLFCGRSLIINIMADESRSVESAFLAGYFILKDICEKCSGKEITEQDLEEYDSEAFLKELYGIVEERQETFLDTLNECNEIWLDIVENYRREEMYGEYIGEISERAEKGLSGEDYRTFQKGLEEYKPLFRKFLLSEFYSELLIPGSGIVDMVVKMQWIAMEYVAMRHGIFLKWLADGRKLNYNMVRDYIVVVSRMMGYDEEDIYEYMENSFESVVWEWGYLAFILGK